MKVSDNKTSSVGFGRGAILWLLVFGPLLLAAYVYLGLSPASEGAEILSTPETSQTTDQQEVSPTTSTVTPMVITPAATMPPSTTPSSKPAPPSATTTTPATKAVVPQTPIVITSAVPQPEDKWVKPAPVPSTPIVITSSVAQPEDKWVKR